MAEEVQVIARGPIFDGRAPAMVEAFLDDAAALVGAAALAEVKANLTGSIRNSSPGGFISQLYERREALHDRKVGDQVLIYGPWLEGTGTRNAPVTRFAGYRSFERARTVIEAQVPVLVLPARERLVAAVNGP